MSSVTTETFISFPGMCFGVLPDGNSFLFSHISAGVLTVWLGIPHIESFGVAHQ